MGCEQLKETKKKNVQPVDLIVDSISNINLRNVTSVKKLLTLRFRNQEADAKDLRIYDVTK